MTQHPTHQFCPNCNALLPPDLNECPQCGEKLNASGEPELTKRHRFQLVILFALGAVLPICLLIGVMMLCYFTLLAS